MPGSFVVFGYTESVANRTHVYATFGTFMISTSTSVYPDGRADVKLAGLLRRAWPEGRERFDTGIAQKETRFALVVSRARTSLRFVRRRRGVSDGWLVTAKRRAR